MKQEQSSQTTIKSSLGDAGNRTKMKSERELPQQDMSNYILL